MADHTFTQWAGEQEEIDFEEVQKWAGEQDA